MLFVFRCIFFHSIRLFTSYFSFNFLNLFLRQVFFIRLSRFLSRRSVFQTLNALFDNGTISSFLPPPFRPRYPIFCFFFCSYLLPIFFKYASFLASSVFCKCFASIFVISFAFASFASNASSTFVGQSVTNLLQSHSRPVTSVVTPQLETRYQQARDRLPVLPKMAIFLLRLLFLF